MNRWEKNIKHFWVIVLIEQMNCSPSVIHWNGITKFLSMVAPRAQHPFLQTSSRCWFIMSFRWPFFLLQITEKELVTKQVFDVKKIKTRKAGGWDKCLGPFTTEQARLFGIDEWQCDGNCYIRIDANGSKLAKRCFLLTPNPNVADMLRQVGLVRWKCLYLVYGLFW